MLRSVKFPLLYLIELALWIPLVTGFAWTVSFLAAVPIGRLDLRGKSLPAGWEAAVPSHGKFLEGHLIANNPFEFGAALALTIFSAAALYPVSKAQKYQREMAGPSRKRVHAFAEIRSWPHYLSLATSSCSDT